MTPLQPPPTVPGHGWTILSALRYGTSEQPAEYIVVVVDCGEGTPTEPHATMHAFVFPDRIKFRDGEYNLTFDQAQRSLTERAHLAPRYQVEVIVLAHEPHSRYVTAVFVDGHATEGVSDPVTVSVCVLYLDPDDEDDDWVQPALHQADTLSPAAARTFYGAREAIHPGRLTGRQSEQPGALLGSGTCSTTPSPPAGCVAPGGPAHPDRGRSRARVHRRRDRRGRRAARPRR